MAEPILIGTRGWDRPEWTGAFYPEILPADWRLSFYANNLRSVLVPAESWGRAGETRVRAWAEETYEEFRFVLEMPVAAPDFLRRVEPIRSQMAGLLLRVPPVPDLSRLTVRLGELTACFPVCVDLPPDWRSPDVLGVLTARGAGLCWHADAEPLPVPGGRLMVALSSVREPKAQRHILETLHAWQGKGSAAALFFDDPEAAQQARLLAELMVV